MITVLSPAKKLSKECNAHDFISTLPDFLDDSKELVTILKKSQPGELQNLMGISENLSILNWERYQNWKLPFNKSQSRQAVFTFQGDTYTGLNVDTLNDKEISFAQDHTRILSGLYGVLRPLDLMMPYRLEMGTQLKNKLGNNLYEFWSKKLSSSLSSELKNHKEKIIINCASVEYFKSIDNQGLNASVVTPIFKDIKNGKPKIISFYAKKARGMMARYIIKNQINNPDDIIKFNLDGYNYNSNLSSQLEPVFIRAQA